MSHADSSDKCVKIRREADRPLTGRPGSYQQKLETVTDASLAALHRHTLMKCLDIFDDGCALDRRKGLISVALSFQLDQNP